MSKLTGINTDLSGKVGKYLFRQTPTGTVVSQLPRKPSIPRRSERQQNRRTLLGNLAAFYRLFDGSLRRGFEGTPPGQNAFNAFIKANINNSGIYITKDEKSQGGAVVAPYLITFGSLPSIAATLNSGTLQSNIALGDLTVYERTKVSAFARAVIDNNDSFLENDAITFFLITQGTDEVTRVPRATFSRQKVVLSLSDDRPLWSLVDKRGFSAANNMLSMGIALEDAGAAWVHSRHEDDTIRVSTQSLIVRNGMVDQYRSDDARKKAIASYGGVNKKAVYFDPL